MGGVLTKQRFSRKRKPGPEIELDGEFWDHNNGGASGVAESEVGNAIFPGKTSNRYGTLGEGPSARGLPSRSLWPEFSRWKCLLLSEAILPWTMATANGGKMGKGRLRHSATA
jgi:hypothetical protein